MNSILVLGTFRNLHRKFYLPQKVVVVAVTAFVASSSSQMRITIKAVQTRFEHFACYMLGQKFVAISPIKKKCKKYLKCTLKNLNTSLSILVTTSNFKANN